MKKVLEFVDVKIALKDEVLFEKINFSIYEGERLMLVGKNGSGKSLLLYLIARGVSGDLEEKYEGLSVSGKILDENGNDILKGNEEYRPVFITQNENFYNNTTVLEQAQKSCGALSIDFDATHKALFESYLKKFNLHNKINSKTKSLSGGEGKIIHLITSCLQLEKSSILLLDEPLNHLSYENSKCFNDFINEKIAEKPNLTIIMISHCKASTFIKETIRYDRDRLEMMRTPFVPYDCFE